MIASTHVCVLGAATARGLLPYALALVLLVIGLYAIIAKKNLVKIIVGLLIADYAVNLFLVLLGYRGGSEAHGGAPILPDGSGAARAAFLRNTTDPLPQALILTSIVIGLGIVALVVSLAVRLHEKYGTFDITAIRKLRG
jgi:multicomponent Na+:H+ antiporter subunit C